MPRPSGTYDRSIIEGPLQPAVWKLAWPTMLANMIGGVQGIIDHALVGNFVGFTGNAAIGVSWQMFLIVIVFIASLFTGMSVLVARFVGADDPDKVNRAVYQAFLTAIGLSIGIIAPLGYVLSPWLLDLVNASAAVQAEALPFLRISFVFSAGMLIFFMLGGALRSAGDARTPMVLGIATTILNIVFNVILIRGLGPIPAYGTAGAAMGTAIAFGLVAVYSLWRLWHGGWVVQFPRHHGFAPDWDIIRSLFRFGLPTGIQGIAMNVGGVLLLSFIGSVANGSEAQAAYAISYAQLFSFITWTATGLLGAAAAVAGQNLGARNPERATAAVHAAARIGFGGAALIGAFFLFIPRQLLGVFGMSDPIVVDIGVHLLRVLSVSGLFIAVALTYTGGLQGTGDTKGPLFISIVSQILVPLSICFTIQRLGTLQPMHIWVAILVGHATRCTLSVVRFNQGKWRNIAVDLGKDGRAVATVLLVAASLLAARAAVAQEHPLGTLREQATLQQRWLDVRLTRVLPKIMREQGVSMWIVPTREYNEDPVFWSLVSPTTLAARRRTIYVFCDRGAEKGVDRIAIGGTSQGGLYRVVRDANAPIGSAGVAQRPAEPFGPEQWKLLAPLVTECAPTTIAVNISATHAFSDGLTVGEWEQLQQALPEQYRARVVRRERLALDYIAERVPEMVPTYEKMMGIVHEIIATGFSAAVIKPGVTRTEDVVWWMRQRVNDLGLGTWFHPSVEVQRRSVEMADSANPVIIRGDVLHCDFGITALGLNTDTQHMGYVLLAGETDAPAGLRDALRRSNRLQDILLGEMMSGKTGNEVLRMTLAKMRTEGLNGTVYTHPIGSNGHGAGPLIGLWDRQDGVVGRGDVPLRPNTWFSIELQVTSPVAEWNGQQVRMAQEEDIRIDGAGARHWVRPRQEKLHIVR